MLPINCKEIDIITEKYILEDKNNSSKDKKSDNSPKNSKRPKKNECNKYNRY